MLTTTPASRHRRREHRFTAAVVAALTTAATIAAASGAAAADTLPRCGNDWCDTRGDVRVAPGDMVAVRVGSISVYAVSLRTFEHPETAAAWRNGTTRIEVRIDINADGRADGMVMFRYWLDDYPGVYAIAADGAGRSYGPGCRSSVNNRFHPDTAQIGFGVSASCLPSGPTYRINVKLIRCDPRTGTTTVDRFPQSGWTPQLHNAAYTPDGPQPTGPSPVQPSPAPACRATAT